jgi:hypothetical protein
VLSRGSQLKPVAQPVPNGPAGVRYWVLLLSLWRGKNRVWQARAFTLESNQVDHMDVVDGEAVKRERREA